MATRVERYLAHLDRLSGGVEPQFYPVDLPGGGPHKITNIVYRDLPEPGMLTGLTYGLSTADNEQWRLGRPELCISMASEDEHWAHAVGYLASSLIHECSFAYGDTIDFGQGNGGNGLPYDQVVLDAHVRPALFSDGFEEPN